MTIKKSQKNHADVNSSGEQPVYSQKREKAFKDGSLVDGSNLANEAGFKIPVALTRAVWNDCVEWDDIDSKRQRPQDKFVRLWDVLFIAARAARKNPDKSCIQFCLHRVPRGGRAKLAEMVILKLLVEGGDNGEAAITIKYPNED